MTNSMAIFRGKSIRKSLHNNEWWFSKPFKQWLAKAGQLKSSVEVLLKSGIAIYKNTGMLFYGV